MPGVLLLHSASSWGPWQKNPDSPKLCLLLEWLEFNDWSVRNIKLWSPSPNLRQLWKVIPALGLPGEWPQPLLRLTLSCTSPFAQSWSLLFPSCSFFPSCPFLFPPFFFSFFFSLSFPNCWFQKHYLINLLHTSTYLRICLPGNPTRDTSGNAKPGGLGCLSPVASSREDEKWLRTNSSRQIMGHSTFPEIEQSNAWRNARTDTTYVCSTKQKILGHHWVKLKR